MTDLPFKPGNVLIDYTNHAGVRAIREIVPDPKGFLFGSTEWHHDPQWLLLAHDVAKDDARTFAVKDIHAWSPTNTATGRSMVSWAKQLQASMERNARMSNRLTRLRGLLQIGLVAKVTSNSAATIIEAIMKDEEPTWPPEL